MPKISSLGSLSSRGFGEFAQQTSSALYVEDVFNTYLYTGTGSPFYINTGVDVQNNGGLALIKSRSQSAVSDPSGGAGRWIALSKTNKTSNELAFYSGGTSTTWAGTSVTAPTWFTSSGQLIDGGAINTSGETYALWTFRKAPKFFDVVTYTGDGTNNRQIAHSLNSTPGMIVIKVTSTTSNWAVGWSPFAYATGSSLTGYYLNSSNGVGTTTANGLGISAVSTTTFTIQDSVSPSLEFFPNTNGVSYVAYLFANNAGGFGADGTQSIIKTGYYTGTGSSGNTITLGWEPQYLIIKQADGSGSWVCIDNMRGFPVNISDAWLYLNLGNAESSVTSFAPTATGFVSEGSTLNGSGNTYIYIAIRRGPMKTPTSGTSVFNPQIYTGDYNTTTPVTGMNAATDMWWNGGRSVSSSFYDMDRLRGWNYLETGSTSAESTAYTWSQTTQTSLTPSAAWWGSSQSQISYFFNRAPGFMDVICYTGTGSARAVNHNLGVVPELIFVKMRSGAANMPWVTGNITLGKDSFMYLNATNASDTSVANYWGTSWPTATAINYSSGGYGGNNASGYTYVAYLFASCPGVSKVGSYTGTGSTQTISCGFTGGARFVLIKRTDSTGDWYAWDSARGMVAGTDPYKLVNTTNTETNTNSVYTTTGGFQIVSTAAGINASGGSYIFLAIA